MPEASNQGVNISYEVTGQGRPLVLLHGHYSDGSWWADTGYLDDLGRDHLLVNVDLRGHGHSDKPHEPSAYRGDVLTSDVLAVADAEGLDRFALWGLSYGGWIAWLTAYSAPQRVVAMITTGAWDPRPDTYEDWVTWTEPAVKTLRRGGMPAVVELYEDEQFQFPSAVKAVLLRADPLAMLASHSSELVGDGVPNLEGFPVPVLLIAGELEDEEGESEKFAGLVPHGESFTLPGLGHAAACAASTLVIPPARAFLDRWFA